MPSWGIGRESVRVAAVTDGIRAFTLAPYVFAELDTARRLALLGANQAFYWVLDLARPECATDVVAAVDRHPNLVARRARRLQR